MEPEPQTGWLPVARLWAAAEQGTFEKKKPTHWLSGRPEKSPSCIFTTNMVFPKSLKFMNSGSETT